VAVVAADEVLTDGPGPAGVALDAVQPCSRLPGDLGLGDLEVAEPGRRQRCLRPLGPFGRAQPGPGHAAQDDDDVPPVGRVGEPANAGRRVTACARFPPRANQDRPRHPGRWTARKRGAFIRLRFWRRID
jgi:hypothetical protein